VVGSGVENEVEADLSFEWKLNGKWSLIVINFMGQSM
jgi:hypothetical protein